MRYVAAMATWWILIAAACWASFVCGTRGPTAASSSAWLEQPEPDVETVHVINSCHLDIGFADTSLAIVNDYFDHHL